MPRLDEYKIIVGNALDELSASNAKIVVMPPLNGEGGSSDEKLVTLENGVALWLETHADSSIEKVFITSL